jgi:hypothetical protein
MTEDSNLPLYSPDNVDLKTFNAIKSPDYQGGKPIKDMRRLFHKQIIVDDETIISVETIKVPGFIGIANYPDVLDPDGKSVSGTKDIVQFLDKYGLLICTYVYHKDCYGRVIDLRWTLAENEQEMLMETFIKNGGHHAGAIIPAVRGEKSFASLNEPDTYHDGLYGHPGFMAIPQALIFPDFVTPQQARGYTDSIICWLALMNSFVEFSQNDFNGGDPTTVCDRLTLTQFLKNCALAALGSTDAIDFLNNPENKAYCAEFIYIGLNTPVFPFNKAGLSALLDGDEAKAIELLRLQERQNSGRVNLLSKTSDNPEFTLFNIKMPLVPEDLPPLDVLISQQGQTIDPNSIPFPPFQLSQVLRRAFRTLLPRQVDVNNTKIAQAEANLFASLEPLILRQLEIELPQPQDGMQQGDFQQLPQPAAPIDPRVEGVRGFIATVQEQLLQPYESYEAFSDAVDAVMAKADELIGSSNTKYFVPPRIYIDLGQQDGDKNLPSGWGFQLQTVGALIHRGAIRDNGTSSSTETKDGDVKPILEIPSQPILEPTPQPASSRNPKAAIEDDSSQKQAFNTATFNW